MVGEAGREDLGLIFQSAKGAGVDDAVAIALESVAVRMSGSGYRRPRLADVKAQLGEHPYCGGNCPSSVIATCPTAGRSVFRGSRSFLASAGFVGVTA